MPNPANKKITVAGKLIKKPIPEDVPTAFFIFRPQLSNTGSLRVPPPIPISDEIVTMKKLFRVILISISLMIVQGQCLEDICLSFDNVDPDAGTLDVLYTSTGEISGYQLNLQELE